MGFAKKTIWHANNLLIIFFFVGICFFIHFKLTLFILNHSDSSESTLVFVAAPAAVAEAAAAAAEADAAAEAVAATAAIADCDAARG